MAVLARARLKNQPHLNVLDAGFMERFARFLETARPVEVTDQDLSVEHHQLHLSGTQVVEYGGQNPPVHPVNGGADCRRLAPNRSLQ